MSINVGGGELRELKTKNTSNRCWWSWRKRN